MVQCLVHSGQANLLLIDIEVIILPCCVLIYFVWVHWILEVSGDYLGKKLKLVQSKIFGFKNDFLARVVDKSTNYAHKNRSLTKIRILNANVLRAIRM